MKINLKIDLPKGKFNDRISGVYIITFDNGYYYIGSSSHLRQRAGSWRYAFNGENKRKSLIWESIIDKIKNSSSATFSVLEYSKDNLFKIEEKYLSLYKNSDKLINVFLYTRIPVIQYDINMNEMVRYNSIKAAANVFGVDQARIRDVVSGRRKSFRGYIFRELILGSCKKVKNIENPIKVRQYDINNNLINQFTTYAEAARSIKRNKKTLMNTLDGKQKTCAGYLFKYA